MENEWRIKKRRSVYRLYMLWTSPFQFACMGGATFCACADSGWSPSMCCHAVEVTGENYGSCAHAQF